MNNRPARLYLSLVVALAATSCVVPEQRKQTVQRVWPATEISNVEVREVDGSIDISAGPPDKILLTASIRSNAPQPAGGYFTTELDGSTLTIRRRRVSKVVGFPVMVRTKTNIDYKLQVPTSVALDIHTINGRIATRGVDGETDLTVVNGSIDIDSAGTNEVSARTVNGDVRASFRSSFQGAHLKTVNGAVRALLPMNASFSCDLSQVNGDFEAAFPVSIHSNPGSRRVSGEVNGGRYELKIATVNGDIEIKNTLGTARSPQDE